VQTGGWVHPGDYASSGLYSQESYNFFLDVLDWLCFNFLFWLHLYCFNTPTIAIDFPRLGIGRVPIFGCSIFTFNLRLHCFYCMFQDSSSDEEQLSKRASYGRIRHSGMLFSCIPCRSLIPPIENTPFRALHAFREL
jgi:hypothetical protein